jgi:hypothetical protein
VALATALRQDWRAVSMFVAFVWLTVAREYPSLDGEELRAMYLAALTAPRLLVAVTAADSRSWRRTADGGDAVLLGLAAAGLVGAAVTVAWGRWDLVCVGNVLAYALACVCCLLLRRHEHRLKR